MNLKQYGYFTSNDFKDYTFYSEGPKGKIKKTVNFLKMPYMGIMVYNLGFGDENPVTGKIKDKVVTNNQDRDTVLATVAATINEFCDHHGDHHILVVGSTPSRTRLYQMAVSHLWDQIRLEFILLGLKNDQWSYFERHINYDAFLVKKKEIIKLNIQ
ncbi:MAG TPA: hypothetical protein VGC08_10620 [Pedobacter sp.]